MDEGELPYQEQADACEEKEEQWVFFQSLQEAKNASVTKRDGEGEEEGEREKVKKLGEV